MNRLRRRLLGWLSAGAGSLCFGIRPAFSATSTLPDASLLSLLLGDLYSATAIAARLPAAAGLVEEAGALHGELAGYAVDQSHAACLAWFQARREDDFANGRTVLVDGWVLARSEAGLCLLAASDRMSYLR